MVIGFSRKKRKGKFLKPIEVDRIGYYWASLPYVYWQEIVEVIEEDGVLKMRFMSDEKVEDATPLTAMNDKFQLVRARRPWRKESTPAGKAQQGNLK